MGNNEKDRESRFFSGDEKELQDIKIKERFQRLKRKKDSRRKLSGTVQVILFAGLAILFVMLCVSLFLKVKHIEVAGNTRYSAEEIISAMEIEYGTNLFKISDEDIAKVGQKLAYVKEISFERRLPDTIVVSVVEDEAQFVADLYGRLFLLSSDLRVLQSVERRSELMDMELVELYLPNVSSALIGSRITFDDEVTDKYVTAYVDALSQSPLLKKTTAFDLRKRFELALIACDLYMVKLGTGTELSTKLTVVAGMLENQVFSDQVPATIDAENPEQCSVIKKADLKVAFD